MATNDAVAASAREAARKTDGKFGTQPLDEAAGVNLVDHPETEAEHLLSARLEAYDLLQTLPDGCTVSTIPWSEDANDDGTFDVVLDVIYDVEGNENGSLGDYGALDAGWLTDDGAGHSTAFDAWRENPEDPSSKIDISTMHLWHRTHAADLDVQRPDEGAPDSPLTLRDVEHLAQNKGVFENGYDSGDINRVLARFESARLACVWGEGEGGDYHGDSEFVGRVMGSAASGSMGVGRAVPAEIGPWREVHPQVWEYLSDPESDLDPESIPSLLSSRALADGEAIDDMGGDGFHNLAPMSEDQD